jgi:hypothetical protein
MALIEVVEGQSFALSKLEAERMREAAERLHAKLKPSFSLLSERAGSFQLNNVVGTIDLGAGTVLQVSPKVATDADWATTVVSLLTGQEGVDVAGERRAGLSKNHNNLLDAIAGVFLRRLERAYRQEGPIVLLERKSRESPSLNGKLDASRWARSALWRPHVFPVVRTEFAHDNPFSRGLLLVADTLAGASTDLKTRSRLRVLSRDLAAGMGWSPALPGGLASRALPEQWSAYKPAWSLAIAVLSKSSLLGPTGGHKGVGLAVEAWPLLETLLLRLLQGVEREGKRRGRSIQGRMKGVVPLLEPKGPKPQERFSPEPDGRLYENGELVAAFEAKYSSFDGKSPDREHTYQAVATAAACGAPLAVLVYPEEFAPLVWDVKGSFGAPVRLVALGLGLYKWRPPFEFDQWAADVLKVLDGWRSAPAAAMPVAA